MTLTILIILFMSYSFFGWLMETFFFSVKGRKFVNRGFLIGPFCPVYGVASIALLLILKPYLDDPLVLFILAMVVVSIVEYFVSYILEKLFKIRWWDYSDRPFNINGRIYLTYSLTFGVFGLLLLYVINPWYMDLLETVPVVWLNIGAILLMIILMIDLAVTAGILFEIRDDTKLIFKDRSEEISIIVRKNLTKQVRAVNRLRSAFPGLRLMKKGKK